jgi:alpha-tubulin suppressor-like RCC1 family protein
MAHAIVVGGSRREDESRAPDRSRLQFTFVLRAVLLSLITLGCGRVGFDARALDAGADAPDLHCIAQVGSHGTQTCILRKSGTVACWGGGAGTGSLGAGSLDGSPVPVDVLGLTDVVQIAGGENTNCARTADGSIYCWGANDANQVGDGTTTNQPAPVRLALPPAIDIAVGQWHGCAITTGHDVWCWGRNLYGALGDGTFDDRPTPVPSTLSNAVAISVADDTTCAILGDATVACVGQGDAGDRGDGSTTNMESTWRPALGLADIHAIDGSCHRHGCVVLPDATVACWGQNASGELGDGSMMNRETPIAVTGVTARAAVATGAFFSCALGLDGQVSCWGENEFGQLGYPAGAPRPLAAIVPDLGNVHQLALGCGQACALRDDNSLWCWGQNDSGELGDGTKSSRETAQPVTGLCP